MTVLEILTATVAISLITVLAWIACSLSEKVTELQGQLDESELEYDELSADRDILADTVQALERGIDTRDKQLSRIGSIVLYGPCEVPTETKEVSQ